MDVINKITESASDCTSTVLSWFDEETVGREVAARNKWVAIAAGVGAAYIALRLAASSQRVRHMGCKGDLSYVSFIFLEPLPGPPRRRAR